MTKSLWWSCVVSWVVSSNVHTLVVVVEYTPIACAKLKQSRLFERGGIYGIDDALQNRSCPMNWNTGAFIYGMTYDTNKYRSRGTPFDQCGARSGSPQSRDICKDCTKLRGLCPPRPLCWIVDLCFLTLHPGPKTPTKKLGWSIKRNRK